MGPPNRFAVGVDIGGTFTDFILLDRKHGRLKAGKTLTTSPDPSAGVHRGLTRLLEGERVGMKDVERLIHGTTLVINALIERKGASTALVTTKGFRDVLRIGREMRYDIYDLHIRMPRPLVSRQLTFELDERVGATGEVLKTPSAIELGTLADAIVHSGVESVAICLLHSYRYPKHERLLEEALRDRNPQLSISVSHRVLAQWREFERACATVMNAYTQPTTGRYIDHLDRALRDSGLTSEWHVMTAHGGIVTPAVAAQFPIRILESGPVGGALAAAYFGAARGLRDLIAFDMGGTTAKVSLIQDGAPLVTTDSEVARVERLKRGSGIPLRLPVIEMIEIGAGGGSIGRVDELGLISVGPESAGSSPGPACYGLGGTTATVTDANLVLGYLDPNYFLGGEMTLELSAAEIALGKLGAELGMTPRETAWGIHSVVTDNMAEAMRIQSVERGADYRKLSMVAFGGAGPAHAYGIARVLDMRTVVFPPAAGVFSAFGFLTAPLSFDFVNTYVCPIVDVDISEVRAIYSRMVGDAEQLFRLAVIQASEVQIKRSVDMRYSGQGYELEVTLPSDYLATGDPRLLQESFERSYQVRYGRVLSGAPIEAVNWRCVASGPRPSVVLGKLRPPTGRAEKTPRRVFLSPEHGVQECPVFSRYLLRPGQEIVGPALVEERECTIYAGPEARIVVDDVLNLLMEIEPTGESD